MCEAVTVWRMEDGERRVLCQQCSEPLCGYHKKMQQGLIQPLIPQDTGPFTNMPIRVEYRGERIWTK